MHWIEDDDKKTAFYTGIPSHSAFSLLATYPLGQSLLTFGPQFHMYTCMHAFATLTASHYMVKVHDVTAKHCALY